MARKPRLNYGLPHIMKVRREHVKKEVTRGLGPSRKFKFKKVK